MVPNAFSISGAKKILPQTHAYIFSHLQKKKKKKNKKRKMLTEIYLNCNERVNRKRRTWVTFCLDDT